MSAQKSTIVRPSSPAPDRFERLQRLQTPRPPKAPSPVRLAFRGLEPLAPGLAARLAEYLWFRLPQPPPAERRHQRTPEGGRPFAVRRNGIEVHGTVFGPDDAPTAVLVHGWGGWWQQLAVHVPALLEAGYRVVAYDAPSHGDSPAGRYGARSTTAIEAADAYAAVVWQQGPADLVVAHSLGAMAVTWARARGTHAAAYVFVAPAVRLEATVAWLQAALAFGPHTARRLVDRVERRVGIGFEELDAAATARTLADGPAAPPLLAIHDLSDHDTPPQGSVDLTDSWPGSDLVLTEGLGHRRVLWAEPVVRRVADFARANRALARAEG